jgi:hypothetical protein
MAKPILAVPDEGTSAYLDKQVKRHRDAWKKATGKGPLLAALAKAFAMATVDFSDCPNMVHVSAKAFSIITRLHSGQSEEVKCANQLH